MNIDEDEPLGKEASKKAAQKKIEENEARRPLIGMAVTLAAMLVLSGITYSYVSGLLDPWLDGMTARMDMSTASAEAGDEVIYDLPAILITMSGDHPSYLKLSVSVEFPNHEGAARIERVLPKLMDEYNLFLSQLRLDDIKGAGGLNRVRAELAGRASALVQPSQVSAILFREINIQ